jgi:hypothetical protein
VTLNYLFSGGRPPPQPFPALELAAEDVAFPCAFYGNGFALEDPAAKLEILDVMVPGGEEATGLLSVALTSSRPIAAFSFRLRFDPATVAQLRGWEGEVNNLTGLDVDGGFLYSCFDDGQLDFGYFFSFRRIKTIGPGEDMRAVEIPLCLKPGAIAGETPLTLVAAEFTDPETGRAIHPRLESGTLRIAREVTPDAGCVPLVCRRPPRPDEIEAHYRLTGATGAPGGDVEVAFFIGANAPIRGFSFSVDFDEEVLECLSIEKRVRNPRGSTRLDFDNHNFTPGNTGVDEGYLSGEVGMNSTERLDDLPPNGSHEVARFHFRVRPEAQIQVTEIRFLDGAGPNHPTPNILASHGESVTPESAASFVFLNGLITVLPEISTFIRGDSNGDLSVDLADAANTLGFLFLGWDRPACYDAADANDDGRIDVADPVGTLNTLFLGASVIAAPYAEPGEDPTPDLLGCLRRYDL